MKQKQLEMLLQRVPAHPAPRAVDEQYETPATVAADILYLALGHGDIEGRKVVDLGCGTGILAIGAKALGAREVVGVDMDEVAVGIAHRMAVELGQSIDFVVAELAEFGERADVVVMNPPFGAQRANRHADVFFLERALAIAPVVYSLHRAPTEEYIVAKAKALRAAPSVQRRYDLTLRATQPFHERAKRTTEVLLLRSARA